MKHSLRSQELLLIILIFVGLITSTNGCATTYSLVKYEQVGPVRPEIWKNNKTGKCERRVYMTVMYVTEVECPEPIVRQKIAKIAKIDKDKK